MVSKPKRINCPKCSEKIPLPKTKDDKIFIKCDSCGAKGKIRNPFLFTHKRERKKPKSDLSFEDDLDELTKDELDDSKPTSIECPRCGNDIQVPKSKAQQINIKCSSCGSKGTVPNPFLDEKERVPVHTKEEIEHELIDCPKCEEEIEIPFSEEETIIVECDSCGAMGRINNPHLMKYEIDTEKEPEPELEIDKEGHDGILEQINCPKCKEAISIPYSTSTKLKVTCDSCGAKGNINNPYL